MNLEKFTVGKAIYLVIVAVFFYVLILFLSDGNKIISVLNQIQFEQYIAILSLSVLNDYTLRLFFLIYPQIVYYQSFYQGEIFLQEF